MLTTIGLWLVLFAILFGVGGFALRFAGRKIEDAEAVFTAFWLGWAFTVAVLQIWNLFAPIGHASFGLIALLGTAGWDVGEVFVGAVNLDKDGGILVTEIANAPL